MADAERQKAVLEITIQERIIEKEGAKNVSMINNDIKKAAENNEADIAKYKLEKVRYLVPKLLLDHFFKFRKLKQMMPCTLTSTSSLTWPGLCQTTQSFISLDSRVSWGAF